MRIRNLKHHPDVWMREDAAIQFDKFEDDHGVISVNRAGVTVAQQQAVIDRWNRGGAANRPPFLYEPKQPPEESEHVQGIAVDTSHITHMLRLAEPYGFYQRYAWDKPHFEFDPKRVRIRPVDSSENITPNKEMDITEMFIADMPNGSFLVVPQGSGKPRAVVLDGGSGANNSGIPRLKFETAGSIGMLTAAVQF